MSHGPLPASPLATLARDEQKRRHPPVTYIFASDNESEDGGVVAGEEVLLARTELPLIGLLELHEASSGEALLGLLHGVEGRRARVHKIEEALHMLVRRLVLHRRGHSRMRSPHISRMPPP